MSNAPSPGTMRIGDALLAARERAKVDLAAAEEGTKIRGKYLRALEQERWDDLPSRSHAKGFLRTYGEFVGLDGELLVDEYRRQVEAGAESGSGGVSERIFERRRSSPGSSGPRRRWPYLVATAALLGLVALVVFGVVFGEDDGGSEQPVAGAGAGRAEGDRREQKPKASRVANGEPVELSLVVRAPVEICLLDQERRELIDGQVVNAGERDSFTAKRFSLRFPAGFERSDLRLRLGGRRVELPRTGGPTAFAITAQAQLQEVGRPGKGCP